MERTHYCGTLRRTHIGLQATVCGWVLTCRDMGGVIFVDVRDREGVVQTVFDQAVADPASFALAAKLNHEEHRVYCIIGDGECDEGAIWESALIAHQYKLDNFIVTIDFNKIQSLAPVEETLALEPLDEKWRAFGWHVIRVDGHDHEALHRAYEEARGAMGGGKPIMVIADTVKGKGVSFMEHSVLWHYRTARGEEYEAALKELEAGKP